MIYAKSVNFDLQKEWINELQNSSTPAWLISDHVLRNYWQYYNGFNKHPFINFIPFDEIGHYQDT